MHIFVIIFGIIAVYLFAIFVLLRLFIPFLGFKKYLPPVNLPAEVQQTILELEQKADSKEEYLKLAYEYVKNNWHSERLKTVTNFNLIFRTDIAEIWKSRGYAQCTTINFILYTLLARSKFFGSDDIRVRHTFFNMVIHQYLQIRLNDEWIDLDPSTKYLDLPIGQHSRYFG